MHKSLREQRNRDKMASALVVDDSKTTRAVLARIVRELGYSVIEAAHGQDALDRVSKSDEMPQLILTDWNMPVMNGLDFVRELRKDPRLASSAVVMVTTRTEMDQIVAALEAGANEYVMKPFTKEILQGKLRLLRLIS
jgi:two-component system chemotaxis response regulator CheY